MVQLSADRAALSSISIVNAPALCWSAWCISAKCNSSGRLWIVLAGVALWPFAWVAAGRSAFPLQVISAVTILFPVWFWIVKLVTEVDDTEIRAQFVFMWRTRHIPFTGIREAEAVTYRPIVDYGGWGIRRGANGWAYNVSGNRGVRIQFRDGSHFLIGSQRAEELERTIRERMAVAR
jgi:hypothetical protein